MAKQKRYSLEFQERAVRRMKLGDNVSQLSEELGVHRTCLYMWKRKQERRGNRRCPVGDPDWRDQRIEELEGKLTRLEGVIGGQWLELDFLESALRRIEGKGPRSGVVGAKPSTPRSVPGCERKAD